MSERRSRLTYANVVSTLALVLVVTGGGAAIAAVGKNAVGSKQIKNGAIKSVDVKDDGLTGQDIKESTLGKVPAAATVDTIRRVSVALTDTDAPKVVATQGPLTVTFTCFYDSIGSFTTSSFIQVRTSQDDARLGGVDQAGDGDFDVEDGNRLMSIAANNNSATLVDIAAVTPSGQLLHVEGLISTRGSSCRADLTVVR